MGVETFKETPYAGRVLDGLRWKKEAQKAHEGGSRKRADLLPLLALKSSPWEARGQHRRNRQGGEGSSVRPGSQERGKGTGWIAWKPGRSRSRPRASKPADRVAG